MRAIQMVTALMLAAAVVPAPAKDVSREQTAVQYARQEFQTAEAEHKADLEQAARTEKSLGALKKQYDDEQKRASLSARKRQQAKERLDKVEEALDRAWKQ